jgi:hypothetical protein
MLQSKSLLKNCLLSSIAVLLLSACEAPVNKYADKISPDFWQRTGSTTSLHMEGPKAQQMLSRDISRCITELRELKLLGALRDAKSSDESEDEIEKLKEMKKPDDDEVLFSSYLEYQNFEKCMESKGWERMEHVPYDATDITKPDYSNKN